tara:strand:+ start:599 stop:886 length:288 start_codon:yes stop_codon:yes gene_type:complete
MINSGKEWDWMDKKTNKMDENIIYIDGIGYCKEITVNRYNENGVDEHYCIYEPIENKNPIEMGKLADEISFRLLATKDHPEYEWLVKRLEEALKK